MKKHWVDFAFLFHGPVICKRIYSDDIIAIAEMCSLLRRLKSELRFNDFDRVGDCFRIHCDDITEDYLSAYVKLGGDK